MDGLGQSGGCVTFYKTLESDNSECKVSGIWNSRYHPGQMTIVMRTKA